jgi:hypothetical protein
MMPARPLPCSRSATSIASWESNAIQAYDQARQLFRKLGDSLGEAHTLSGLGEVERDLGDRDLAQRDFGAAAQLYDAAGQSDRAAWAQQQADELAE